MNNENSTRIDCIVKLTKTLNFNFFFKKPKQIVKYYVVYKITNILKSENDLRRFYIGKHVHYNRDPKNMKNYFGSGTLLTRQVKKYGRKNFKIEIIEFCKNEEHLCEREVYWIKELKANYKKYPECGGMNLTDKSYGDLMSEESKEKLSKTKKGQNAGEKNPMYGVHHTDESKEKIRQAILERDVSGKRNPNYGNGDKIKGDNNPTKRPEVREKIGKAHKGKKLSEEHKLFLKNREISEETRKKNSDTQKLRHLKNPELGFKYLYELSNGEIFEEFFDENDRQKIRVMFCNKKSNVIIFKGITIIRKLRNESNEK